MKFVEWTDDGDIIVRIEADDLRKAIFLDDTVEKIKFADEIINLCTEHAYDEEPEE